MNPEYINIPAVIAVVYFLFFWADYGTLRFFLVRPGWGENGFTEDELKRGNQAKILGLSFV